MTGNHTSVDTRNGPKRSHRRPKSGRHRYNNPDARRQRPGDTPAGRSEDYKSKKVKPFSKGRNANEALDPGLMKEKNLQAGEAKARAKSDGNVLASTDKVTWGLLVSSNVPGETLSDFMKEFQYENVVVDTLPAPVDEREVGALVSDATAFCIVQHKQIDVELLKDEWLCGERVGTLSTLAYIELLPPEIKGANAMRLGNVHRFGGE